MLPMLLDMILVLKGLTTAANMCLCGERRMDYLVWLDDNTVRCLRCGQEYRIPPTYLLN